jgi:iron complex transport system substrate-binding protein
MADALIRTLAAVAFAVLAPAAYADVAVVDDTGRSIRLASPARRIVALAPHATELVFAAGAGSRIVGVVRGSNHPEAARSLPVIGDVHAIDLERIIALRPDLIVSWPYTTPAQVDRLRARGVAVFVTDPRSIDGIAINIERLGVLAGTQSDAAGSAAQFRRRVAAAVVTEIERRVRVFYEIWNAPLFTIGADHLITQAIAACGGENVFASIAIPAPQVSVEAVIAARPEAIIAGTDGAVRPPWLDDWRTWTNIPAVREGLLHVVDADRLHRPGPRFAEGVAELCAAIAKSRKRRADR